MPDIRFATKFRSADTDDPGLVMEDDGTVWLINPDGTRTQLPGGGGGGPGSISYLGITFVETPGAGTYTGSVPIPADSIIVFTSWTTTAAWDAATAELDWGWTGALTEIDEDTDVKPVSGLQTFSEPGDPGGAANMIASVTTTGAGGSTGRTMVFAGFATVDDTVATKA